MCNPDFVSLRVWLKLVVCVFLHDLDSKEIWIRRLHATEIISRSQLELILPQWLVVERSSFDRIDSSTVACCCRRWKVALAWGFVPSDGWPGSHTRTSFRPGSTTPSPGFDMEVLAISAVGCTFLHSLHRAWEVPWGTSTSLEKYLLLLTPN
jgi:hypothetical protein